MRRVRPADLAKWDLSCLKALGCGAEPILAETMFAFERLFGENCRLSPTAIMPAYGLAEATLAVTMKPLHKTLRIRNVDKTVFQTSGLSKPVASDSPSQTHVSSGVPFPGHSLAIMNSEGISLPECVEGEVWIKGPSVGAGYYNNISAWDSQMRGDWLQTGDLGYMADGELYVTGRIKDLIILNGRNVHPQEIEWIVSKVDGVRPNCVVAFSCPTTTGEGLVVALETNEREHSELSERVEDAVFGATLSRPVEVVCLRPNSLPRTSSGKLKRQQIRSQYFNRLHHLSSEQVEQWKVGFGR
jgi:fatty-acyl-CoA synthase